MGSHPRCLTVVLLELVEPLGLVDVALVARRRQVLRNHDQHWGWDGGGLDDEVSLVSRVALEVVREHHQVSVCEWQNALRLQP